MTDIKSMTKDELKNLMTELERNPFGQSRSTAGYMNIW